MNDFNNMSKPDDFQIGLDRLADGELSPDEQRQLLTALENQPDGWRRCALAFVEAQALRYEMQRITTDNSPSELADRVQTTAIAPRADGQRRSLSRWRWFAMAASILAAFLLGVAAQRWLPKSSVAERYQQVAATQSEMSVAPPAQTVATNENPNATEANSANSDSGKWQALKVTIPTADGQGEQTVEVPLVAADEQKMKSMLENQKPLLSDVAVEALENTGHEVTQHRAYYPVQLEDGTQAIVPMDFVEVQNTSSWQ